MSNQQEMEESYEQPSISMEFDEDPLTEHKLNLIERDFELQKEMARMKLYIKTKKSQCSVLATDCLVVDVQTEAEEENLPDLREMEQFVDEIDETTAQTKKILRRMQLQLITGDLESFVEFKKQRQQAEYDRKKAHILKMQAHYRGMLEKHNRAKMDGISEEKMKEISAAQVQLSALKEKVKVVRAENAHRKQQMDEKRIQAVLKVTLINDEIRKMEEKGVEVMTNRDRLIAKLEQKKARVLELRQTATEKGLLPKSPVRAKPTAPKPKIFSMPTFNMADFKKMMGEMTPLVSAVPKFDFSVNKVVTDLRRSMPTTSKPTLVPPPPARQCLPAALNKSQAKEVPIKVQQTQQAACGSRSTGSKVPLQKAPIENPRSAGQKAAFAGPSHVQTAPKTPVNTPRQQAQQQMAQSQKTPSTSGTSGSAKKPTGFYTIPIGPSKPKPSSSQMLRPKQSVVVAPTPTSYRPMAQQQQKRSHPESSGPPTKRVHFAPTQKAVVQPTPKQQSAPRREQQETTMEQDGDDGFAVERPNAYPNDDFYPNDSAEGNGDSDFGLDFSNDGNENGGHSDGGFPFSFDDENSGNNDDGFPFGFDDDEAQDGQQNMNDSFPSFF